MSWHFSQALADQLSQGVDSGKQFALSKSSAKPETSLSPDKMMERFRLFLSGTISAHLTAGHGEDISISSLVASPARISARPGKAQELLAKNRGSGKKCFGSFAKFDQNSYSWKTPQFSIDGGLMSFSGIWPLSGMMLSGVCYRREPLAHGIKEKECGYLLVLPTLTASDNTGAGRGPGKQGGDNLRTLLPTLTASMETPGDMEQARYQSNKRPEYSSPGPLNPAWCEWYMGYPIGWTDAAHEMPMQEQAGWGQEPDVPRMKKIKCGGGRVAALGNAWVPAQAKKAFELLWGRF